LFNKLILAAILAAASLGAASAATTLNVYIKDELSQPVMDVTVAAIEFGLNGPSTNTVIDKTGTDGRVALSLADNKSYSIHYTTQGYSPSISDQFNNPAYDPNRYVWATGTTVYSTFTVTSGLANVGRIVLEFANATHGKVLFGGLNNNIIMQPASFGIAQADGFGNGFLVVDNVPFADASVYNIGMYDAELNRGVGRNVATAIGVNLTEELGAYTLSYSGAGKVDFDNSIPPSRVDNNTSLNQEPVTGSTLEGIVRSTGTLWSAIPRMGVNFRSCNGYLWANVDDNGHFTLNNLSVGATYYAEAMGGCSWSQSGPGACYAPYRSPALVDNSDLCSGAALKGINDFIYVSSTSNQPVNQGAANTEYVRVQLSEMAESTGTMKVCVKSSEGDAIPNANVNINPDGSPWSANKCATHDFGVDMSTPGFSNKNVVTGANGCADLNGLPSGNYLVNVWTPFSNSGTNGPTPFNAGPDTQFSWGGLNWQQAHCEGVGVDDYRVTIDTMTYASLHVYNSSGVVVTDGSVALSSITYVVPTAAGANSGLVKGTLKFPSIVDLFNNPIMITLYPSCKDMACPVGATGNFKAINGSGASQYAYTINVSSGYSYYMNVSAAGWGRIQRGGGDNSVHLESTGTVVVDMEFGQAGTVTGTLYKPDGSVFVPATNQWVWIAAGNNNGWSNTQLQKDGTFAMTDVLPGVNWLSVGSSGDTAFTYSLPSPAPTVTVAPGSTATLNVNLVNANYAQVKVDFSKTSDQTVISDGSDSLLGFKAVPLLAGTVFKSETIIKMLTGGDSENERKMRFSGPTSPISDGQCGSNWPGGFCPGTLPSPAVYDFYLMRSGDFGKSTTTATNLPYPHFTMITSSKNVVVDNAHANTLLDPTSFMSAPTGIRVVMTPNPSQADRGNATLTGSVIAANFFRAADYDATGGNFDNFVKYLPVMALYDDKGVFSAAGIVVPPPGFIANHDAEFNLAFSQGYPAFKALLESSGGFGYEIRALKPSTCYTAVLTTPNYPPYQRKACVGVSGSTLTMSVDLDAAVGAGATLQGVVTSTNTSVNLVNAGVEISGDGIGTRTMVTTSSGTYRFEGLPEGSVRVKVTVAGFAAGEAEKDITGTATFTQSFALTAAPGSIAGTVYSQKLPFAKVQTGALIYAYDDTYNGLHPSEPLSLIKTVTGADGTYTLNGLVDAHTYKIFLRVPGKYMLNQSVAATAGAVTGIDFTMLAKPLDIEVFAKQGAASYDFTVLNPQDFKTGTVRWGVSPYSVGSSAEINMEKLSSGELHASIPLTALSAGVTYVLHGEAESYAGKTVTKELLFGLGYKGNAKQAIDAVILGDDSSDDKGRRFNEASMDQSGDDPSSLVVPAGAMLPVSTAAIPTCSFKGEDKDSDAVAPKVDALGANAFAGGLYTVEISSVALNPDKGFDLTLAYDKSTAQLDDLAVARFNDTTSKWETVPGIATVNPVKGTVKVKLKSLASVLAVKQSGVSPQFSSFNGREYIIRPQATGGTLTSGTFAVVRPSVAGGAFTGSKVKVFNFPNPFNLKSKVVANNHGAPTDPTTLGTTIHVEVPAGKGGPGHVKIYTLAGELVKDISVTFTDGAYNYVNWDGHNAGGQPVANGVYYGFVTFSGSSPSRKDATFKMAVIK